MVQVSGNNPNTLVAVLVGALAVAVAVIGWLVFSTAHPTPNIRAPMGIDFSLPRAPLPEGPKMPNPPIPKPQ